MQSDSSENDMEQNQTNIKAGEPQSQHQQLNEQETAPKVKSDQEELQSETLSFNIEEETDEEESEKSHSTIDVEGGDQTTIANTDQLKDAQDMDKPQLHDTRQVPEQKLKKFEEGLLASFIQQYEKPFKGMKEAFTYYKQYKIDNDGKTKLNLPILAKQCDLTSEHCKNLFMNTEAKYLDKWDQKTKDQVSERLTELWNQPHVESNKDYQVKIKEQVLEEFKIRQQVAKNYREMKSHIHYKMKQLEKQVPLDPKDSIEHLQENNENDSKPEANQQNEDKKQTVLNEKLPTLNFKTIQKTDGETVETIDIEPKIIHSNEWYYVDLNGQIQGPYSTKQMNKWNEKGKLPLNLLMQRGTYSVKLQEKDQYQNNFFKDDPNVIKEKSYGKKLTPSSKIQEKQNNNLRLLEVQSTLPISVGGSSKCNVLSTNSKVNENYFSPEVKNSKRQQNMIQNTPQIQKYNPTSSILNKDGQKNTETDQKLPFSFVDQDSEHADDDQQTSDQTWNPQSVIYTQEQDIQNNSVNENYNNNSNHPYFNQNPNQNAANFGDSQFMINVNNTQQISNDPNVLKTGKLFKIYLLQFLSNLSGNIYQNVEEAISSTPELQEGQFTVISDLLKVSNKICFALYNQIKQKQQNIQPQNDQSKQQTVDAQLIEVQGNLEITQVDQTANKTENIEQLQKQHIKDLSLKQLENYEMNLLLAIKNHFPKEQFSVNFENLTKNEQMKEALTLQAKNGKIQLNKYIAQQCNILYEPNLFTNLRVKVQRKYLDNQPLDDYRKAIIIRINQLWNEVQGTNEEKKQEIKDTIIEEFPFDLVTDKKYKKDFDNLFDYQIKKLSKPK
ncbi:GYF_domain [Hexamita inflata]|uniref:GYF domain n=1 Tax=Hexamita inflata TaxID=28002 RepID=A0AA86UHN3_9EUKA|nr:GYF domain [Hexamita inflata]